MNKVLNLTYDKKAYILNQGEYSIIYKVESKLLFLYQCINGENPELYGLIANFVK